MAKKYLFKESQKFKQWWLWLIILGIDLAFLITIYKQVFLGESLGDSAMSNVGLVITSLILLGITALFLLIRLDTKIDATGIYVRFYPIRISYKFFAWDSIKKMEIRKYNSLYEYGGWGIRYGNGKALNVSGNMGLQLEFTDKSKLLIGTNKAEELEKVITKYNKI